MIIGYLDNNQRNISTDEQRDIVNQYARNNAYNIGISIVSLYNYLKLNPEPKNMTNGGQHA